MSFTAAISSASKNARRPQGKGQLISECLFGIFNFPKKQWKIWQISALGTNKCSNQQSKAILL